MSDDADFLRELRKEFLDEARFLIDQCEESYLRLESPDVRAEELAKIFRLAHSMKGAGAAVGFNELSTFAHAVEDCLSILRTWPDKVDAEVITLLLRSGDAFKEHVQALREESGAPWEIAELKAEVVACAKALAGTPAIEKTVNAPKMVPEMPAPMVPVLENKMTAVELEAAFQAACAEASAPESIAESIAETIAETIAESTPESLAMPEPNADAFFEAMSSGSSGSSGSNGSITRAPAPPLSAAKPTAPTSQTAAPAATSIKVDSDRIDTLLNVVGELVVIKSQLMTKMQSHAADFALMGIVSLLDKTVRDLQDKTLSMRMTPLKPLFLKAQRTVRDLSVKLGKPVEFGMKGEETEIDRTLVDQLGDPLLHLVRNSIDHGIEKSAELRVGAGKAPTGRISVSSWQAGGRVHIAIEDDGNGISRERVLKKAQENGLLPPGRDPRTLSDAEVFAFLFSAGFSTAEKVTDVSGRGVGLDVVKTNIERMRGTIEVQSTPGKGSKFTLSLPLTTSIADGLLLRCGDQSYIAPLESIQRLIEYREDQVTETSPGQFTLRDQDQILSLFSLRDFVAAPTLQKSGDRAGKCVAVVIAMGSRSYALKVDAILGQTQVVLKPLADRFRGVSGLAGASILGDGTVGLVLDTEGMHRHFRPSVGAA